MARRDRTNDNPHYMDHSAPATDMGQTTTEDRLVGVIVRVNPKGFGFIKADGIPKDVFFHTSAFDKPWDLVYEGVQVSFELVTTDKGLRAERIQEEV